MPVATEGSLELSAAVILHWLHLVLGCTPVPGAVILLLIVLPLCKPPHAPVGFFMHGSPFGDKFVLRTVAFNTHQRIAGSTAVFIGVLPTDCISEYELVAAESTAEV
jgi:hypothetical protein